jgi:hypothetical protein
MQCWNSSLKKNWNSTYLFPHRNNHHQKYIFFTRRREGHEGTQNDSCRFITFPHLFLQQNAVLKFFSKKKLKFYLFIPSPEYHHQKYIFFHTKTQRARRNTKRFMPIKTSPIYFSNKMQCWNSSLKKNWNSTYLFPHRNNHHQKYIFFTRRREGHEGTQNDSCRFITLYLFISSPE